jgi:O-antigen biosynthesis protein
MNVSLLERPTPLRTGAAVIASRWRPTRIAVCEAGPLTPDRDAGCRAVSDLVATLSSLGCEVFVGDESAGSLPGHVQRFSPDAVVISRPGLFARLHASLTDIAVPKLFFAHDLHHVRLSLQRAFDPALDPRAAEVMRLVEGFCFRTADLSVLPTTAEAAAATTAFPGAAIVAAPYFAMPTEPRMPRPPGPVRLVFVGGAAHAPNRDGVAWFIREIWPTLHASGIAQCLAVCGAWPRALVDSLARPGVEFHGPLSEPALAAVMRSSTAGIAPLRFGAGLKRKTLDYLSRGLPVLSTVFGVQGLFPCGPGRDPPGVIVCAGPADWIAAVRRLGRDATAWQTLSEAGHDFITTEFSSAVHRDGIHRILQALGVCP